MYKEFIAGDSGLFYQNWEESSEPSVLDLFFDIPA